MKKASRSSKYDTKEYAKCPFCDGNITKKYQGIADRLFTTKDTFDVSECNECGTAFINPMPTGEVGMFYPSNYLSSEGANTSSSRFDIEKWYRYNQYKFDFKLLRKVSGVSLSDKGVSYIDIGCGSGERVTFASDLGCSKAYGLDKFDFAKKDSKQNAQLISSEIMDYHPSDKFTIVSMFHVLEHVENPDKILSHIQKNILKKNGKLIVQVPNYNSWERKIFGRKWFGFDVPRHIWQYNNHSLSTLLEESGYKVDGIYQKNAPLHPVTTVPSMFRELDFQRIWVDKKRGNLYKQAKSLLWAVVTVLVIPINIIFNIFNRSSMLTIVATKKG